MDRRSPSQILGQNISDAMDSVGATPESVAEATDMHPSDVRACLTGERDLTVTETAALSVAFSVSHAELLAGVAA